MSEYEYDETQIIRRSVLFVMGVLMLLGAVAVFQQTNSHYHAMHICKTIVFFSMGISLAVLGPVCKFMSMFGTDDYVNKLLDSVLDGIL